MNCCIQNISLQTAGTSNVISHYFSLKFYVSLFYMYNRETKTSAPSLLCLLNYDDKDLMLLVSFVTCNLQCQENSLKDKDFKDSMRIFQT